MDAAFDLSAYLRRVEYAGPLSPDMATVRALHIAHVSAIPFENIDVQAGLPIRLDIPALQAKLVQQRRGGYCFEQNTVFMHALQAIGVSVAACEARVRQGAAGAIRPRTHMVLIVSTDGGEWLADVGFGGDGLTAPIDLRGGEHTHWGDTHRVRAEGELRVLQLRHGGEWEDLYAFIPNPVYAIDFAVANWFTSTHPESAFIKNLTAQRATADGRHILRNFTYTIRRGDETSSRQIDRHELVPLLRDVFLIDIQDDMRFPALEGK